MLNLLGAERWGKIRNNKIRTVVGLCLVIKLDKCNSLVGSGISVPENAALDNVAELLKIERYDNERF